MEKKSAPLADVRDWTNGRHYISSAAAAFSPVLGSYGWLAAST